MEFSKSGISRHASRQTCRTTQPNEVAGRSYGRRVQLGGAVATRRATRRDTQIGTRVCTKLWGVVFFVVGGCLPCIFFDTLLNFSVYLLLTFLRASGKVRPPQVGSAWADKSVGKPVGEYHFCRILNSGKMRIARTFWANVRE